jgi:chemotaxis protein MotB
MKAKNQSELDSEAATTQFDADEQPIRSWTTRNNNLIFPLSALLLGIAVALGYYAWTLWSEKKTTSKELSSAKIQVVELKRERSQSQQKVLQMQNEQTSRENELQEQKAKTVELEMQLSAAEASLEKLREKSSEAKELLKEFRAIASQFKKMVDSGRLEVRFRRGRMIVELPAEVLFPSGSADLTEAGATAIKDVAKILKTVPNKRFVVAGHTDSVPISNDRFRSNWALSSARAVNVTEALIRWGIDPNRLGAVGYAEYDPIAGNVKESGRKKNRRIEIVLEPRLKEFPEKAKASSKAKKKK